MTRQPHDYVHGQVGTVVVVPARISKLLERHIAGLRTQMRGFDPEAYSVLEAMRISGAAWMGAAPGTPVAVEAEPAAESVSWLNSSEVALRLRITARGVRKAALGGRLVGEVVAGRWRFRPEDVKQYQAVQANRRG